MSAPPIDFNAAHAVWFYNIPPEGSYLAALVTENEQLKLICRIRDPSGARWYEATPKNETLDQAIQKIGYACRAAVRFANLNGEVTELLRGDLNGNDWARLLMAQPWTHVTQMHTPGRA